MTPVNNVDRLKLITEFRNYVQDLLSGAIKVKMQLTDLLENHPHQNSLSVFLTSFNTSGEKKKTPPGEAVRSAGERRKLLGKPRDYQRFLDKEGPSYDEGFMLDIEFDFDAGTCTVHNINLPLRMRNLGIGGGIVRGAEILAKKMDMSVMSVPAEHRAAAFWLKNGYSFSFESEKKFYQSNSGRSNLYIAYDMRKEIKNSF